MNNHHQFLSLDSPVSNARRSVVKTGLFTRFLAVGGIATGAHYILLVILASTLLIEPIIASSIGFVASATLNYALNYFVTFNSSSRHRDAIPRFAAVAGGGLLLNYCAMSVFLNRGGIHYMAAQIFATGLLMMWSFALHRFWTYTAR